MAKISLNFKAGSPVQRLDFAPVGVCCLAVGFRQRAAGVKAAAAGQINGVGRFALQDDALAAQSGVGYGHHRKERFGVGV